MGEKEKAVYKTQPRKISEARKHLLRLLSTKFEDKDIEIKISYQDKENDH